MKASIEKWDESKTIQDNAHQIGICYNQAAVFARDNNLRFLRKKQGAQTLRDIMDKKIERDLFPIPFKSDKQAVNDGQTFGCEGAD